MRYAVAVSGGVDSMYMAWKCRHLRPLAITVDHGLRPESADEAKAVGTILRQWGLDHQIVKVEVPGNGLALEENARLQRYAAIKDVCTAQRILTVLVAHTADDQVETFYMRLMRGSSLFGLRGLLPKGHFPMVTSRPLWVERPLLTTLKQTVIEEMIEKQLPWFEDKTNHDPLLTHRNSIRSLLAQNPQLRQSLVELHQQVVDANIMIDSYATSLAKQVSITWDLHRGLCVIDGLHEGDPEILTRFLFYTVYPISSAKLYPWLYTKFESLVRRGLNGTVANLKFSYTNGRLTVSQAPKPRYMAGEVTTIGSIPQLYDNRWWVNLSKPIQLVIYNHKIHQQMVCPPLIGGVAMNGVPAEIYQGKIVGFPTFTEENWHPKHNIYFLINASTISCVPFGQHEDYNQYFHAFLEVGYA